MNCEKSMKSLWDLVDGTLPPPSIRATLVHLRRCPACADELDRCLRLDDELRALPALSAPATLSGRVMDTLPLRVPRRPFLADYAKVAAALLIALAAIFGYMSIETTPIAELRDAVREQVAAAAVGIGDSVESTVDLLWSIR